MRLYESHVTPNSRRVRIFLAEKEISLPITTIDLASGDHLKPEFWALNPLKQIPVLELDEGQVITESVAICRYFEETFPKPALFGTNALERSLVEMWQRRAEFGLFLPVMHVFRHTHPAMAEIEKPQILAWAEVNKPRVMKALDILNSRLESNRFLVGDQYTIADITAQVAIDFMRYARLPVPEPLLHLNRWMQDVSSRPSAKA